MPKISVIIPVYNTEKYISKCLESIIKQTYTDIEIICINDFSNDNSGNIIKEYTKSDNRIKLLEFTSNKGVSAARNSGIKISSGDYIYFIDSDDWIEKNYLEIMLDNIEKTNSDIVVNRNMVSVQNDKFYPYNFQKGQLDIPDNSFINIEKDTHNVSCGPCNKLYKLNLLKEHSLYFPEGYTYEDIFFHYITFAYSKKIYFFYGSEYFYRKTDGSLTSTMILDSDKVINIFNLLYEYYEKHNLLNKGIKIYYTLPFFNIQNEETYNAFKAYFLKAGNHILNSEIYNDLDKFICNNILNSSNYNEYISKYSPNVAISYIRKNK